MTGTISEVLVELEETGNTITGFTPVICAEEASDAFSAVYDQIDIMTQQLIKAGHQVLVKQQHSADIYQLAFQQNNDLTFDDMGVDALLTSIQVMINNKQLGELNA